MWFKSHPRYQRQVAAANIANHLMVVRGIFMLALKFDLNSQTFYNTENSKGIFGIICYTNAYIKALLDRR